MVRAGVVTHPLHWVHSGYREIQRPPKRYAIIDLRELAGLCGFADSGDFLSEHRQWVEQTLEGGHTLRDDRWSEAIAVGNLAFVESVKNELGSKALHRALEQKDGVHVLRERSEAYNGNSPSKSGPLRLENTVLWNENTVAAKT